MPTKFYNLDVDTTLGGNSPSDNIVPSQKAIKTYVDNNSGGGSVAIDGTTITKNSSDQIQAVATVNKNTAAGATNPVYDWVGTLAEYTTQDVATNHPDWVCFITDDDTAEAYDAYSKTQSDARYVQKAHEVIEFQAPSAQNNYTWYRKYRDGWVEQGGTTTINTATAIPIIMADSNYTLVAIAQSAAGITQAMATLATTKSTNSITISSFATGGVSVDWQISGMYA